MVHHVIVAYDISDDKRRNRVAGCLEGYGFRVNYSVFECILKSAAVERMERDLRKLILAEEDSVRIYRLCSQCIEHTTELGNGPEGFYFSGMVSV